MSNGLKLTDEAAQARREYYKKWREANKEHCKEYRRRYWEKKAAQASKSEVPEHETED